MPVSLHNIINEVFIHRIHIFFILHPVIFAAVFGAMGTVRDEKERQRAEFKKTLMLKNRELERANRSLQELDELKDNLLSMVSHELRTPLTTIQGYITFLRSKKAGAVTDEQLDILDITEEQTGSLNRLIEELLDLSKIQAGKLKLELEPVDLTRTVQKTLSSFRQPFGEKGIILENRLPDKLPSVMADHVRMAKVFTNLLENAMKFTNQGGKVTVSAKEKEEALEFCVEDTGIGIEKENIDKVFDRFYQADSTSQRKYGGCGLGLAISKHIMELHKRGRIWIESKPGQGSRFFFELEKTESAPKKREETNV